MKTTKKGKMEKIRACYFLGFIGVPQHTRSQTAQLQSESYTTTAPHFSQVYFFPLFLAKSYTSK